VVSSFGDSPGPKGQKTLGIDRTYVRLAVLGVLVFAMFTALFSRLWYLQVLASEDYRQAAKENRRRIVLTDPVRGRILDRDGEVLVDNRSSRAITIDRQVIDRPAELRPTLRKLAKLLVVDKCMQYGKAKKPKETTKKFQKKGKNKKRVEPPTVGELLEEKRKELRAGLGDRSFSPYEPVPVAYDVSENAVSCIEENPEDFRGVAWELTTIRQYPQGEVAAHILGRVAEISEEELKSSFFRKVRPRYQPGDLVGKEGVERTYDRYLRGEPGKRLVIVNSAGDVIHEQFLQRGRPGQDLVLSLDADIQRVAEQALADGVLAAHGTREAPGGAAVVMDPNTGGVVAMASYPGFNPTVLADGITEKEYDKLGAKTKAIDWDDALVNRAIRAGVPPGSTFKVVTAGAAMETGIASAYTTLECPGSVFYPPDDPFAQEFPNWTSANFGSMGFPESLEVSCDTFYYQLGWRMESAFSENDYGDGTERFQEYIRKTGIGRSTGIDLPYEFQGVVPDMEWCERNEDIGYCPNGWLPGYTVNMAIGQGDLKTNPLQMAVALSAIANGGNVMEPHVGAELSSQDPDTGEDEVVREIEPTVVAELGLDDLELSMIREGMQLVVSSGAGTANDAFAGFPVSQVPVAGKTGTAQIGETPLNYSWFIAYAPADAPEYVIAVYLDRVTSHGGESAAPIAREILEGIFKLDKSTDVQIASGDESN
jgi:penicillin-binding protein 2